ncbi:hypothetical protein BDZ85DRAFT_307320 [Elsinoe ampelina]|uniref:Actin cortical patch SUR7/pH-response regulator pali n=1 Tax=Elsinoe ampelina TaxID=302913 RepID=A0A6A6GJ05_9PEZI|nr:hypothetical protein BDZ85DRAFT_307320 [Elsinoe ampelina]
MALPTSLRSASLGLLLWLLSPLIFLLTLFPLMSSTSPSLSNIYLLSAAWNTESRQDTSLRIGYYGLCWVGGGSPTLCVASTGKSAQGIAEAHFPEERRDDTIRGIQFALDLQRKVFVAFMTAGGLAWLVSLGLITMVILAKGGNAGRSWRVAARMAASVGAVLMVASAWATTQAVRAMVVMDEYTAGEERYFAAGNTLVGLQWVAAILACGFAVGVGRVAGQGTRESVYTYNMGR